MTFSLRTWYWIATIAFALWLFGDGVSGLVENQAGLQIIMHLGYPGYVLIITGGAKVLAGVAILQTRFRTIKEWAFAGYTIDCIGASASHFFGGDNLGWILLPMVFLALMFIPYWLWKKTSA